MKRAMDELERVDIHLARMASVKDDPTLRSTEDAEIASKVKGVARRMLDARLPGFFPREMRVPTETPAKGGWDHHWRPPPPPSQRAGKSS